MLCEFISPRPFLIKQQRIFYLLQYNVVLRDAVPGVYINLICNLLFDG